MANGFEYEIILEVYMKEIRSVLEYGSVVYHHGLTQDQSKSIESVQRICLGLLSKYIQVKFSYSEACIFFFVEPLFLRRLDHCRTFIKRTLKNKTHDKMFQKRRIEGDTLRRRKYQEYQSYSKRHFESPLVALTRMANTYNL